MNFNERLVLLREEKQLTQKELSASLQMSMQTRKSYESGKTQPQYNKLLKIADFFDVSTDYLLGQTKLRKNSDILSVQEKELLEYYKTLSDKGKKALIKMLISYLNES